jgi:hypothetical protein
MRWTVVSLAQIAATPGCPLDARYWVNRWPGEPYPAFLRRQEAARQLAALARDLGRLSRTVEDLRASLGPPPPRPGQERAR